jgi:hypothetical protein
MLSNGQPGLSREAILAQRDLVLEAVEVPSWGGVVYVRNLSGKGRDAFEGSRIRVGADNKVVILYDNIRARLLSMTLCDAEGTLLFSESDIEALGQKDAKALDLLFVVAQRLSGVNDAAVSDKIKNSEAAHSESSSLP